MQTIRHIAFGYSTRCNMACDHCVAAGNSADNGTMGLETAVAVIREMARCRVSGISFTAGEPFLYRDEILELVRGCKENGIYSRMVTNGFWAKTREKADAVVSELILGGLSQLRISFSRWHQAGIPKETIINAVRACKRRGLDYFVSFVTDFSRQDDVLEAFLRDNRVKYFPEPLLYFGRAKEFEPPAVFTDYPPNTCTMNPYLSPDLDMFACCDAGAGFTRTGFFYLGNHREESMETLFRKKEENTLYDLIRSRGLTHLASYLGFKASDIVRFRRCELCEMLFNSRENLKKLEDAVTLDLLDWKR